MELELLVQLDKLVLLVQPELLEYQEPLVQQVFEVELELLVLKVQLDFLVLLVLQAQLVQLAAQEVKVTPAQQELLVNKELLVQLV